MTQADQGGRNARPLPQDLAIDTLGRCLLPSPVTRHLGERGVKFVGEAD